MGLAVPHEARLADAGDFVAIVFRGLSTMDDGNEGASYNVAIEKAVPEPDEERPYDPETTKWPEGYDASLRTACRVWVPDGAPGGNGARRRSGLGVGALPPATQGRIRATAEPRRGGLLARAPRADDASARLNRSSSCCTPPRVGARRAP
jgi:hypothetical protein